jgi:hypothetical protein
MSTAPAMEPTTFDKETEELLADPEIRADWEALGDPEDREDLIDHLKVMRRIREGKEETIPWEEVKAEFSIS